MELSVGYVIVSVAVVISVCALIYMFSLSSVGDDDPISQSDRHDISRNKDLKIKSEPKLILATSEMFFNRPLTSESKVHLWDRKGGSVCTGKPFKTKHSLITDNAEWISCQRCIDKIIKSNDRRFEREISYLKSSMRLEIIPRRKNGKAYDD